MKVIGLTGGIGTGKSTASEYLKRKNCVILDADEISRRMTRKGAPAVKEIEKTFGREYITEDGAVNRIKLGNLVFNDRIMLGELQHIITDKVTDFINGKLKQLAELPETEIVIIDAPLLFECGMEHIADENWLVTAPLEVRIKRVASRDGLTRRQILDRMDNQMPQKSKEQLADFIIDNSEDEKHLYNQLDLHLERIKDGK